MSSLNISLLSKNIQKLAEHVTSLHFEHHPELLKHYGEAGKTRCYEDAVYHLQFLAEAMTMNHPGMYANYILWAASMLESRNISDADLRNNLNFLDQATQEVLGNEFLDVARQYTSVARKKLKEKRGEYLSYVTDTNPLKNEVNAYSEYLLQGNRRDAMRLINELIERNISVKDVYQNVFQVSQYEIGRLWQLNKITVAHEHYCTAATQQIMSGLYPHIFSTARKGKTLVACCISEELHEVGIRMVSDFFEMDGWDTYYLGANMPDGQLERSLKGYDADVLALSVTLPTHVSRAAALIKKIRANSEFADLKIMVGGYPFLTNSDLWERIDADAFAQTADEAVIKANNLLKV